MSKLTTRISAWFLPGRWLRFRPSGGVYLAEIDGLRFVAIMSVLVVHVSATWVEMLDQGARHPSASAGLVYRITMIGGYGVELFFLISGFVLALPFLRYALGLGKPVVLGSYLMRRLTRLEPPYILSMLGFFLVLPVMGKGTWEGLWPNLWASLFYCHELIYRQGSVLNNNAWSLEIEVQFYLLVPLIFALFRGSARLRQMILVGAILVSSVHFVYLPEGFPRTLIQFMQFFSVGILLCERWLSKWQTIPRSAVWDGVGSVAIGAFLWVNLEAPAWAGALANPWMLGLFFAAGLRGRIFGRALTLGWVPVIGGMCYSIYLLHARAISVVVHTCFGSTSLTGVFAVDFLILFAIAAPISVAVSAIFYALIERPCMDPSWPSKLRAYFASRPG